MSNKKTKDICKEFVFEVTLQYPLSLLKREGFHLPQQTFEENMEYMVHDALSDFDLGQGPWAVVVTCKSSKEIKSIEPL